VAFIQGASHGIGRGIAEALAAEGCDLFLTSRTEAGLVAASRELIGRHGVRVHFHSADSGNIAEVQASVAAAIQEFGRLDILVANSGGPPAGTFRDLTLDQWRAGAELLLVSPVALLKAALPTLEKSPTPRFFVITSSSSRQPVDGLTLSNTYRPGVVGLIKALAGELAPKGICCHSLAPGRIDTARLQSVIEMQAERTKVDPSTIRSGMVASIPLGRIGKPADLGNLAAFLSSPLAGYLTGQNWLVDGGLIRAI
jgi:3-oxoacyl-[acyl-carrier protein] reductase